MYLLFTALLYVLISQSFQIDFALLRGKVIPEVISMAWNEKMPQKIRNLQPFLLFFSALLSIRIDYRVTAESRKIPAPRHKNESG